MKPPLPTPAPHAQVFTCWYLTPGAGSPWRFAERATVLQWNDGETIAFRPEIDACVRRVAANLQCVPPFAAYVVLLAAARQRTGLGIERILSLRRALETPEPDAAAEARALSTVVDTNDALSVLRSVPPQFWQRSDAVPILAEAVFERSGLAPDPAAADLVVRGLEAGLPAERLETPPAAAAPRAGLFEALVLLRRGLVALDTEALLRRAETGVEHDVRPADVNLPDCERTKQLLAALTRDPEHAALARLAHDLMAALRLPRPRLRSEDLPLGDISGLDNRGPLDRLLPSELAHDDLILAVRVALNEALYLRRESPPRALAGTRCILVDAGIRMWGVARVFATAVAMACAGTSARHTEVRAFRASDATIEPIDLGTCAGVVRHLAALATAAHPGAAVPAFLAACDAGGQVVEAVLVTHTAVLQDAAFAPALAALGAAGVHVVAIDAGGRLELWSQSPRGRVLVREARLDLKDLLGTPVAAQPPAALRTPGMPWSPAICSVEPFPLLLPHRLQAEWRMIGPDCIVAVTTDRRVMLWRTHQGHRRGARQVVDRLPGRVLGFAVRDETAHILCANHAPASERWTYLAIGIDRGTELRRIDLPAPESPSHPLTVLFLPGTVAIVLRAPGNDALVTFDPESGLPGPTEQLPREFRWCCGRFFRGAHAGAWHALVFDGNLRLERVPVDAASGRGAVGLIDRPGHDGPWVVQPTGKIVSTVSGASVLVAGLSGPVAAVSQDGNRLQLQNGTVVYIEPSRQPADRKSFFGLEPRARWVTSAPALVKNFAATGVQQGKLRLLGRNTQREIVLDAARNSIFLRAASALPKAGWLPFAPVTDRARWSLRAAVWPGSGSRVVLDSRGLLHLASGDPSIAEVTLVLVAGGPLAGWASDGAMHGSTYFVGDARTVSAVEFYHRIAAIVERLQ